MFRSLIACAFLLLALCETQAANCFWVGGTGTWDNSNAANWSSSSGGSGSTCNGGANVPSATDTVTFDASSGGGTVTVAATFNASNTVVSLTMGAFTGTVDFAANDPNITVGTVSITGTGTRTLNMGDGTWTITGVGTCWDAGTVTNLTFNANSSTLTFTGTSNQRTLSFGGRTYNIVNLGAVSSGFKTSIFTTGTFAQLNISAPLGVTFPTSAPTVISTAFTWSGTAYNSPFIFESSSTGSVATISVASGTPTINWAALRGLTFSGGATFTANNSTTLGGVTGITVNGPSGGGGSHIIGGGL